MERAERGRRRGKGVPEMDLLYFIVIFTIYSRFFFASKSSLVPRKGLGTKLIQVLVQHRKALWEMATGECKSHPQILHTTHLWRIVAWYGGSGDYCCGIFNSGHFLHTISFQCLHPSFQYVRTWERGRGYNCTAT